VQNWDISASKKIDRSLRLIPGYNSILSSHARIAQAAYPVSYPVGRRFDTAADGGETRQSICIRHRIVVENIKVSTYIYSIQSWIPGQARNHNLTYRAVRSPHLTARPVGYGDPTTPEIQTISSRSAFRHRRRRWRNPTIDIISRRCVLHTPR
jgi:hypothetical protein